MHFLMVLPFTHSLTKHVSTNDKTVVFLSDADTLNRNVLACKILLHFMAFKNSYCNRNTKSVNTKTNTILL